MTRFPQNGSACQPCRYSGDSNGRVRYYTEVGEFFSLFFLRFRSEKYRRVRCNAKRLLIIVLSVTTKTNTTTTMTKLIIIVTHVGIAVGIAAATTATAKCAAV